MAYITETGARLTPNIEPVEGFDKPWAVVLGAGTDDEMVWSEHSTFAAALKLKGMFGRDGGADIMKRGADGSLTTEF